MNRRTLHALLRLLPVPRLRFTVAVVLGALTVVFGVGLMATAGYLISRAAERPGILSLMVAIVAVQFFGLGRPVLRYLARLASHDMTLRVLGAVRARFFERIEPLAPSELDCYRKGDLMSRMVADVDALQNLYLRGLEPPLVALLAGAVSVAAAIAFLPAAGLVLAAGLLAAGVAVPALAGILGARTGCRQAPARGELSAELVELLRGGPELVAFGADEAALDRVRARYPREERPALDNITLRLEPGERVALLGPSGAGKTTVANLMLRFLDPERGRVSMAGRDVREFRQEDVRRAISVAGQESHLFSASIRDNVRLARPDASDDEIAGALRRARIWDWICRLPDGLDTFVGEEGRELSGGQRQRIILARALLAGAPVLVLDEPTAHLDPLTASELVNDVFSAAGDKTVLLITHRSEGLDLVDRVTRLDASTHTLDPLPR